MTKLTLQELELELIDLLASQGLPIEEIRLIGLLGRGSRATVFSVIIDGVYHVLKVYDTKENLQAELKNLKKIIPKDRFLFWWEERIEQSMLNIAIIEVPEGKPLTESSLNEFTTDRLSTHLAELHGIRYRQNVSVSSLQRLLRRHAGIYLKAIEQMGQDPSAHKQMLDNLNLILKDEPDLFRVSKVRTHGDLHWPNIIVAKEDVYLIDWESMGRGDAALDIGKLRIVIYWGVNNYETVFWDGAKDRTKVAALVKEIAIKHAAVNGDKTLSDRLKVYLPFECIKILSERYLAGHTETGFETAVNNILADEALVLASDPFAIPPSLDSYGYFEALMGRVKSSSRI